MIKAIFFFVKELPFNVIFEHSQIKVPTAQKIEYIIAKY